MQTINYDAEKALDYAIKAKDAFEDTELTLKRAQSYYDFIMSSDYEDSYSEQDLVKFGEFLLNDRHNRNYPIEDLEKGVDRMVSHADLENFKDIIGG